MTQLNNKLAGCSLVRLLSAVREAEDKAEQADNRADHSFYRALTLAITELQERRRAAEAQEPVAWTDAQELRDVEQHGCGYLFTVNPVTPNADPRRVIKLYAEPQPVAVPEKAHSSVIAEQLEHVLSSLDVTDHQRAVISCAVDRLNNVAEIIQRAPSPLSVPGVLDYQGAKEIFNYLMTEEETNATVNGWNACSAAMLNAEPVSQPYKLRDGLPPMEHLDIIKFNADCAMENPDGIYVNEFFLSLDEIFGEKGNYSLPVQAKAVSVLIAEIFRIHGYKSAAPEPTK